MGNSQQRNAEIKQVVGSGTVDNEGELIDPLAAIVSSFDEPPFEFRERLLREQYQFDNTDTNQQLIDLLPLFYSQSLSIENGAATLEDVKLHFSLNEYWNSPQLRARTLESAYLTLTKWTFDRLIQYAPDLFNLWDSRDGGGLMNNIRAVHDGPLRIELTFELLKQLPGTGHPRLESELLARWKDGVESQRGFNIGSIWFPKNDDNLLLLIWTDVIPRLGILQDRKQQDRLFASLDSFINDPRYKPQGIYQLIAEQWNEVWKPTSINIDLTKKSRKQKRDQNDEGERENLKVSKSENKARRRIKKPRDATLIWQFEQAANSRLHKMILLNQQNEHTKLQAFRPEIQQDEMNYNNLRNAQVGKATKKALIQWKKFLDGAKNLL